MALQKQMLSIPMRLGVDTEESPALVDGSRFLQLANAVFDKGANGEIHKRNGFSGLPMVDAQGYAVGQTTTLGVFNQEQLLAGFSANPANPQESLYGFGDVDQSWNWRGSLQQITPTERIISNQGTSATAVDMVSTGGLSAYAWISGAYVFAELIDEATGGTYANVINSGLAGVQGTGCRLVVNTTGTAIFLFVLSSGVISVYSAAVASPAAGFAAVEATLVVGVNPANGFDVCMTANGFAILTCTVSGVIKAYSMAQASIGTIDSSLSVFSPETAGRTCCSAEGTVKAFVAAVIGIGSNSWQIQTKFLTVASGSLTAGSAVIVKNANTGANFVAAPPRMACVNLTGTEQILVYEIAGIANSQTAGSYQRYTTQPQTGWAEILEAGVQVNRTLGFTTNLWSAPFAQAIYGGSAVSQVFVFQVFPSQTQQTLFLQTPLTAGPLSTTLQVAGKYMSGQAGPAPTSNALPRPQLLSSGVWAIGALKATQLISVGGQLQTVYGVAELALNFLTTPVAAGTAYTSAALTFTEGGSSVTLTAGDFFPGVLGENLRFQIQTGSGALSASFDTDGSGDPLVLVTLAGGGSTPTAIASAINAAIASGVGVATFAGTSAMVANHAEAQLVLLSVATPASTLPGRIPNTQLGGNSVFAAGSQVYGYDGQMVSELGFNVYPEPPVVTFQTSQVSIVLDVLDPTLAVKTALSIYIPDNAADPGGAIGFQITPGEYFVFNAYSGGLLGGVCFYFTVNGVGSAPSWAAGASYAAVAIPLTTSSTAETVAQTTAQSVLTGLTTAGGDWTVAYTPTGVNSETYSAQRITCVLAAPAVVASIPTMHRAFSVNQLQAGASGTFEAVFGVSCCPASLIAPGQYFTFSVLDTAPCIGYCWFRIAGVGVDPAPFLPSGTIAGVTYIGGVEVVLVGNENEVGVATAINTALTASPYLSDSTITQAGNQIIVNSTVNGQVPAVAYSNNPANIGVAQGYCGTVVDNVAGYEAQQFVAVYEKWDAAGQLHQSAPSVPTNVYVPVYTATGGGIIPASSPVPPSAVFTVGVQNLFLTQKEFLGGNVSLAIYQTQSDQSLFYRITNPTAPLLNASQSLTNTTFVANQPDSPSAAIGSTSSPISGLSSNAPLYTTGGVYENDTPPCAKFVCNSQDRIFLGGLEQDNTIAFSKPFQYGQGLGFSDQQSITINSNIGQTACGAMTGLGVMDGNTIIFQENAVQYISGTGPTVIGSGQAFSNAQLVASSTVVGCRDPGSIALTPNGFIFKSSQGWYLLNRSLQLMPIGKKVQAFNADVCTSAVCVPNSTQVRCLCGSTGTSLLYDWFYDDWAPWPNSPAGANPAGWDACINPSGVYTYVNAGNGIVQNETPGYYADPFGAGAGNVVGIQMSAQTAWLKLNGVSGFGAVWKVFLKGYFLGSQPYLIQIAYDYNPTVVDSFVFQPLSTNGVWGGDSTPWGSGPVWGGGVNVNYPDSYQIRIYPSRVHCTAIQITVTEEPPYSVQQTWSLDAIDLEVGIRKGGRKVGITRSIG